MTMQQFCLRWNNHQPNFISVFSSLLNSESLVDVTLAAEGRHLQAHKVVLSACSSYFQSLFSINPCQHPIVILKDVKFIHLKVMVDFMYYGEVNVSQEQLPHILKTAEMLKIKGLAEMPDSTSLTKSQSGSTERAELLTPGDSNWSSDAQRRSLSPSPCPLSPSTRRKRLRKSSTGSGSGSTERTSEDHPNEPILLSPSGTVLATHIKPDPGFISDSSTPQRTSKQHSSDSELQRDSSQESVEGEAPHQITLQVPQQSDVNMTQGMDSAPTDMSGPSTSASCSQPQVTGLQWAFVEHTYPRFAMPSCQTTMTIPSSNMQYNEAHDPSIPQCAMTANQTSASDSSCNSICHSPCTSPSQQNHVNPVPVKRKRSVNPQADENFVRALEAVRFGGIGFCKAARMYGVNNRTLWLEYKKRGYPINRPSVKTKVKQDGSNAQILPTEQEAPAQLSVQPVLAPEPMSATTITCPPPNSTAILGSHFPLDFPASLQLQRTRFPDANLLTASQSHINMHGLNYSQM